MAARRIASRASWISVSADVSLSRRNARTNAGSVSPWPTNVTKTIPNVEQDYEVALRKRLTVRQNGGQSERGRQASRRRAFRTS